MVSIVSQFEFLEIWLIFGASFAGFTLGYIAVFSNFYAFSSKGTDLGRHQTAKLNAGFVRFARIGWAALSAQAPLKQPYSRNRSSYRSGTKQDGGGSRPGYLPGERPARFRDVLWPTLFGMAAFFLALGCTALYPPAHALAGTFLGVGLLTLTVIDIRHFLLPDIFTGTLGLSGLVFLYWFDPGSLAVHALSGLLAFAVITGLGEVYRRWRGHDGIGQGDAKLMAVAGIWLGPSGLGPLLLVSALLALGFLFIARICGRMVSRRTAIPFGAFLSPVMFALWCLQSVPD